MLHEVTLSGLLDGGWSPEDQGKIEAWRSEPPPILQRGEGLEVELIIDHAHVRKLP